MFTLKFYRQINIGTESKPELIPAHDAISCTHYSVEQRKNGWIVTTYDNKEAVNVNGVERVISKEDRYYQHCYVDNIAGKTIDHLNCS